MFARLHFIFHIFAENRDFGARMGSPHLLVTDNINNPSQNTVFNNDAGCDAVCLMVISQQAHDAEAMSC